MARSIPKEDMIEDLKTTAEKVQGNLSMEKHSEKGEIPAITIASKFETWNEAKKQAGLETTTRGGGNGGPPKIPEEKLIGDLHKINELVDENTVISRTLYCELGEFSAATIFKSLEGENWDEIIETAGIDQPNTMSIQHKDQHIRRSNKKLFDKIRDELESKHGWLYIDELEKIAEEKGGKFDKRMFKPFFNYLKEETEVDAVSKRTGRKNKSAIYIDADKETKYREYLKQIPEDRKDTFMEAVNYGQNPKSTVAAINYMEADKAEVTQDEVAEEAGCTAPSLRRTRDFIQDQILTSKGLKAEAGNS